MNSTIEKLSQILADTQAKLQYLATAYPDSKPLDKIGGRKSNPGNFLLDVLTEWSQQLVEKCHELQQISSHPHERCREIMEGDLLFEKTSTKSDASAKDQTSDVDELLLGINNLREALEAASSRLQGEAMTILSLKQRLQVQTKPFYQVIEDHEKELQSLSHLYSKLNPRLSNDVNHTKSTLKELRTRYNYLILTLENLLGEAGKKVVDLQNNTNFSKLDDGVLSHLQQYGRANEMEIQKDLQKRMDLSKLYDGRPSNPEQDEKVYEMQNQRGLHDHFNLTSPMGMDLPMLNDGGPSHFEKHEKGNEKEIQRDLHRDLRMNMDLAKLCEDVESSNMGNYTPLERLGSQLSLEANAYEAENLKLTSSIKELTKELRNQQYRVTEMVTVNEELRIETHRLRDQVGLEVNEHDEEKFRFTNSINELKKQIKDQQFQISELSRISQELVGVTEGKETKIRRLQQTVKILENNLAQKSKEASKFSKEVSAARKVVNSNRTQCKKLRHQLEQCKKELSRYVIEGMTFEKSAAQQDDELRGSSSFCR